MSHCLYSHRLADESTSSSGDWVRSLCYQLVLYLDSAGAMLHWSARQSVLVPWLISKLALLAFWRP